MKLDALRVKKQLETPYHDWVGVISNRKWGYCKAQGIFRHAQRSAVTGQGFKI